MASPKGKDPACSLLNKRTGMILYDNKCSCFFSALTIDLATSQQPQQWLFIWFFFSSSCLVANLFWLRIYLSPHVDISSYCIKKNRRKQTGKCIPTGHQAQKSYSNFKEIERGLGGRLENRYIYEEGKSFWHVGLNWILDCGYFSQLLVIFRTA